MPVSNSPQSRLSAPGHGFGGSVKVSYGECAFTGTITTADSATICNLPVGAVVLGATIEADDLDTGGSPTITLNVGDAGSANRYFAASTVAQTGAVASASAATGVFNTVAAGQTAVIVAVAANAATSAAGSVRVAVQYYLP
ncbi:hypothetical protein UFOVP319_41 [uncultured Caudovirales phage]|uniref:Uncharacterized protein n=1 Tax=uncultured Caudovirales phage TaxID=2100421 RepID=A0A6J5LWT0_9CAUD|nr:hypothetical protein UFOVP319_41 [uncultured Caudovirales phage]